CLVLLQYADDLFVCETIALHPLVLSNGPELTSKWIISTGQGQSPLAHLAVQEKTTPNGLRLHIRQRKAGVPHGNAGTMY
ncbi:hypothetical protein, partial [Rhizobium bangladeshense]|uniref:hypothetical protein n=1 Tax=Rhizobium bangladeshense TaxID=1138189 RepID=UPI001ABFFB81